MLRVMMSGREDDVLHDDVPREEEDGTENADAGEESRSQDGAACVLRACETLEAFGGHFTLCNHFPSFLHAISQSVSQSVRPSVRRSVSHSLSQSVSQSVCQSVSQSASQ